MKITYTVKYRQPGQWFWRTLKNVQADGIEKGFRFFHLQDDSLFYISLDAEVYFSPVRQTVIASNMAKEIGQPVVRA